MQSAFVQAKSMTLEFRIASGKAAERIVRGMISAANVASADSDPVETFEKFTERYKLDLSDQPAAFVGTKPVAYCLFIKNPGAIGTVMLPPTFQDLPRRYSYEETLPKLLKLLADQIDTWNLALIQTIAAHDDTDRIHLCLRGGFNKLTELSIMEAPVRTTGTSLPHPQGIGWLTHNDQLDQRFAQTIVDTYVGSMDCPELTGLRAAEEILEGHRYSGTYQVGGWYLLQADGRDVGVVLLNGTEEAPDRLELVYMGIVKSARGRGLGKAVMQKAMQTAATLGKKTIKLAVDTRNEPALELYRRFGFHPTGRQVVLAVLNGARRQRIRQTSQSGRG